MIILAIETSCDETSIAIIKDGRSCLGHALASQIKAHRKYGGVMPELASRMHTESIHDLIDTALSQAQLTLKDINAIGVTYGPGLEGALLIGLTTGRMLAKCLDIPLIGINHLHGHIYSAFLSDTPPSFPFICLMVSGGHTLLALAEDHFQFKCLGQTRDDAAGEAFDKVARLLKLPYPGGPQVEKQALMGNKTAFQFPRAMLHDGFDFSFSGLKTAVRQEIEKHDKPPIADICASFQQAVIDVLIHKTSVACDQHHVRHVVLCGGVSANKALRQACEETFWSASINLHVPDFKLCTDNAVMIGIAAYYHLTTQHPIEGALQSIKATPQLSL